MENPVSSECVYEFTLILSGVEQLTREVVDGLFEAGCDDATLSLRGGVVRSAFDRAAPSLKEALLSAIRDVRKANVGADVAGVDEARPVVPEDSQNARVVAAVNSLLEAARQRLRDPELFDELTRALAPA